MAYSLYEEWDNSRGGIAESALWDNFSSVFLDCFIPVELSEMKAEEFVKLNRKNDSQGVYLKISSVV